MITIKDVAKRAGVSTATVSFVINGTKNVAPETKAKVKAAISELNFRMNHFASNIRVRKSGSVAFLVPDMSNQFFIEIAVVIEKELRQAKYNLILANTDESLETERFQVDNLLNHSIDGLILSPSVIDESNLFDLIPSDLPLVFFDRVPKYPGKADCVASDNISGAREAVEYLISLGHRKIAMISGTNAMTASTEREEGYIEALVANGIEIDRSLIFNGDNKKESTGFSAMKNICKIPGVTAVFMINNPLALGALRYLNENGRKVPEDFSFISFDDFQWMNIVNPSISAVKQNTELLGKKLAEILLLRLSHKNSQNSDYQTYRIPTT
ncbi:MAG: LacI family transcriptional regulator, partial [Candidatus Cloacimonetes bacterium]|nr:LacI family transcriptional regulator [Candidatus Cloacimonadota bacterium]